MAVEWWRSAQSKSLHVLCDDNRLRTLCGTDIVPHLQVLPASPDQDPEKACANCCRVLHKHVGPRSHRSKDYYKKPTPIRKAPKSAPQKGAWTKAPPPVVVVPKRVYSWRQNQFSALWHLLDDSGQPQCRRFDKRAIIGMARDKTPSGNNCCIACWDLYREILKDRSVPRSEAKAS